VPELLFAGASMVGQTNPVDVRVIDGVIASITPAAHEGDAASVGTGHETVFDATDCLIVPAFVDLHTHTREPGKPKAETAASASATAAAGGYCVIHAMANTTPVTDSPERIMAVWQRGRDVATVNLRPVGAVTLDLAGEELAPIEAMHDTAAAPTVFSDDGHCVARADVMRAALRAVKNFDGVIAQHAQEPTLTAGAQANEGDAARRMGLSGWPAVAEAAIVARDVLLAADTGARLHVCHVSTAATVDVLRWAKDRGIPVTAEVTPHHLILTDDSVLSANPVYKVNPPLRSAADVHAVRAALADGTIDAVATDHAPHEAEHKQCAWADAAMGMIGLETALAVVWKSMIDTGLMDMQRLVEVMSTAPARIGRVSAPDLALGSTAQIAVIDPDQAWSVEGVATQSLSSNTPFGGHVLPVRVVATVFGEMFTHRVERSGI